jgi:hypothetical protein
MVSYRTLVLRLASRRIARLENAPRHGLRLLKPAPRYLQLVKESDERREIGLDPRVARIK